MGDGSLKIIEHFQDEIAILKARGDVLHDLLKEYAFFMDSLWFIDSCIVCGGVNPQHMPGCKIDAALGEWEAK